MKKVIILFTQFFAALVCFGQHTGVGLADPQAKLHVAGNFMVNQPFVKTQTAPTPAQTKTLVHATTTNVLQTDSTVYIYDPGGPAGNYTGNLSASANIYMAGSRGYELNFEDIDLGPGDSVIVHENFNQLHPAWYAVGNGFSTPVRIIVPGNIVNVTFKSNNDGINGRGFRLLMRALYENASSENLQGFAGSVFFFEPKLLALRSGIIGAEARGLASVAFGIRPIASGQHSTAIGYNATATGSYTTALGYATTASSLGATATGYLSRATGEKSTAMGYSTAASGSVSTAMGSDTKAQEWNATAMGYGTIASGQHSTAMGNGTTASGTNSLALGIASIASGTSSFVAGVSSLASGAGAVAIGTQVAASGPNSTAMGNYVSTAGYSGAFIIGDNSTTTPLSASGHNAFRARFVGGYALFTGLGPSVGVVVNPGGNSWSAISDIKLKENFLPVNGEDILRRISKLPLTTWNYIGQDKKTFRHHGPMAQDFYQAFGHDGLGEIGCDTLINQQDFLGINLVGIQALEKRTTEQQEEIGRLSKQVEILTEQNRKLFSLVETRQKKGNRRR